MPEPSPRDLRHSLVTLGRELSELSADRHVMPAERLRVLCDRMASVLVATASPAALSVAEAVKREPGRFQHDGTGGGAQPGILAWMSREDGQGRDIDRRVRISRP